MSEEFQNNWAPRKEQTLKFTTGNACVVKKPGPELALKTAHLNRRLAALRKLSTNEQGKSLKGLSEEEQEQAGLDALETMTDEQKRVSYDLMCVTVAACVVRPPLHVNPKPGQVGVNDIAEEEFLAIWNWYQAGCPDLTNEPEGVTAEEADRFPAQQGGGEGTGDSGGDVRAEAVAVAGN